MTVRIGVPTEADSAAVRAVAPLVADLSMRCGPFDVPAGMAAASPDLESQNSDEAAVLRQFLLDDPWHGMGSVHPGGWLLLARDEDTIVFGQRHDAIGLGYVVVLVSALGRWTAKSMGGYDWDTGVPAERVTHIDGVDVAADGRGLVLHWTNGVRHDVVARVETHETDDAVDLLLVTIPGPDRDEGDGWVVDLGVPDTAAVTLRRPLAERLVRNGHELPPRPVERVRR